MGSCMTKRSNCSSIRSLFLLLLNRQLCWSLHPWMLFYSLISELNYCLILALYCCLWSECEKNARAYLRELFQFGCVFFFLRKPFDFCIWVLEYLHHKLCCKNTENIWNLTNKRFFSYGRAMYTEFFLIHPPKQSSLFSHLLSSCFFSVFWFLSPFSLAHAHILPDSQESMSWLLKT